MKKKLDRYDLINRARWIAMEIQRIPYTDEAYTLVPAVFVPYMKELPDRDDRYEVFRLLDEQPGLFPNYATGSGHWHALLRQCRNRPEHGRLLFDIFKEDWDGKIS